MKNKLAFIALITTSTTCSVAFGQDAAPAQPASMQPSSMQPAPMQPSSTTPASIQPASLQAAAPEQSGAPAPITDSGANQASTAQANTVHAHDGFFLSVQLPVGYRSTVIEESEAKLELSGTGGGLGLQIGSAVADDLVLYGELSLTTASNVTARLDGEEATTNLRSDTTGLGVGVAYYFMPLNVYLGGAVLWSDWSVSIDGNENTSSDDQQIARSNDGVSFIARAGKEFWVSQNWALGAGLEGRVLQTSDKQSDAEITGTALSAVFSGTYN